MAPPVIHVGNQPHIREEYVPSQPKINPALAGNTVGLMLSKDYALGGINPALAGNTAFSIRDASDFERINPALAGNTSY